MKKYIWVYLFLLPVTLLSQGNWTVLNSGSAATLYDIHFLNSQSGYVCGTSGTVLKTLDGGLNWQDASPPNIFADLNNSDYNGLLCCRNPFKEAAIKRFCNQS